MAASKFFSTLSSGQKRFLQFGVPMLAFVVAGSFGLKEFTDIKIKRRDSKHRKLSREEALNVLPRRKDDVTLEDAYSEINERVDIDTWENKRGPRPWEDTPNGNKK